MVVPFGVESNGRYVMKMAFLEEVGPSGFRPRSSETCQRLGDRDKVRARSIGLLS